MLVEVLENVKTLNKPESKSKRKYSYVRKLIVRCEICLRDRELLNRNNIKNKSHHHCSTCSSRRQGLSNKGKPAYNKGVRKEFNECKVGKIFTNTSGYSEVYVGHGFDKNQRRDKYRLIHRLVLEVISGRKLLETDRVHHIDGNKTNNIPPNLHLCESMAAHRDIHQQLENVSMMLVQKGVIQFDKNSNKYYLPHLEEILDAYSVNSGETYVLEINKLGDMAILSQADPRSEGATTIPLGSRV